MPQAMTSVFTAGVQPPPIPKPDDRYRGDTLITCSWFDEITGVKQSGTYGRGHHQRAHLAEIKQERFSGYNKTQQLKTRGRVVAYHL